MKERKFLGEGKQHTVWEAHRPGRVLKPAKLSRYLALRLLGLDSRSIAQDFQQASELTKGSKIQVPKTRIIGRRTRRFGIGRFRFSFEKGYVADQEEVTKDDSVDIKQILLEENKQYLLDKFDINPDNFIPSKNLIYWIDPVKGIDLRILEKSHLITPQQYAKIRLFVKKIYQPR